MMKQSQKSKYTICHPVVFAMVMQDAELCRELLQRILPDRKIREIRFLGAEEDGTAETLGKSQGIPVKLETEKTIIVGLNSKSIRLDVLFEDDEVWYDLEMQVYDTDSPAKRSRYYHAAKTVASFKRGQLYSNLKPGYVIFICMFDQMGLNQPLYRFEMREIKNFLPLNDGQVTIFLNGVCTGEVPACLQPFYLYLQSGAVNGDEFVSRMDAAVQEVIQKEEVRYWVTIHDEIEMWKNAADEAKEEALARIAAAKAAAEAARAQTEAARAEAEAAQAEAEAAKAQTEAALRLNRLTQKLLELGRAEDAMCALKDEARRQVLMDELNL